MCRSLYSPPSKSPRPERSRNTALGVWRLPEKSRHTAVRKCPDLSAPGKISGPPSHVVAGYGNLIASIFLFFSRPSLSCSVRDRLHARTIAVLPCWRYHRRRAPRLPASTVTVALRKNGPKNEPRYNSPRSNEADAVRAGLRGGPGTCIVECLSARTWAIAGPVRLFLQC